LASDGCREEGKESRRTTRSTACVSVVGGGVTEFEPSFNDTISVPHDVCAG
jgi:hypothetical protein